MNILGFGLDTLKIGFYVDIAREVLDKLEEIKQSVGNNGHNKKMTYNSIDFYVQPTGIPRYKYILNYPNGFRFQINERPKGDAYPNVIVRVGSYACHNLDFYNILLSIIKQFGKIEKEKVSEVHMKVDVDDFNYTYDLHNHYVSCANKDSIYRSNRKLQSAYIGSMKHGDVCLRIYNKTEEMIEKRKGAWLLDYYKDYGQTINGDIWRFEFEIKRKFLKEFNIESFKDLMDNLDNLWSYLTRNRVNGDTGEIMGAWISYKHIEDQLHVSRCPVMDWWKQIANITWFAEKTTFNTRIRINKLDTEQLEKQAVGCISTLMASFNYTIEDLKNYFDNLHKKYKSKIKEDLMIKNVQFQL